MLCLWGSYFNSLRPSAITTQGRHWLKHRALLSWKYTGEYGFKFTYVNKRVTGSNQSFSRHCTYLWDWKLHFCDGFKIALIWWKKRPSSIPEIWQRKRNYVYGTPECISNHPYSQYFKTFKSSMQYSNLRNKFQSNLKRNSYIFIQEILFQNVCEMVANLTGPQCVHLKLQRHPPIFQLPYCCSVALVCSLFVSLYFM